jgi:outer membrane protein OmpA-like peptidoglycan-associated protein
MFLLLAAALTAAQPGPPPGGARFVVCPGNARCPARPFGRPGLAVTHGFAMARPGPGPERARPIVLAFASETTQLDQPGRAALDRVLTALAAQPSAAAVIEAYADPGEPVAESVLSGRRGLAVAAYLADHGIAEDRIRLLGWRLIAPLTDGLSSRDQITVTVVPPAP